MPQVPRFSQPVPRVLAGLACLIIFCPVAGAQIFQPDRLLVGSMTLQSFANIRNIPLPAFRNQKLCSTVTLAPNTVVWAYVPTPAERTGDFSPFSGQLIDPLSNQPVPGGFIPTSRLPGLFAWRLAPAPAAPGEPCVTFPANSIQFSTANYITGRSPADGIFASPSIIPLVYTLGSTPRSAAARIVATGISTLSFVWTVTGPPTTLAAIPPITNLSVEAVPCCTTPSTLNISVRPANLVPGFYRSLLNVIPINTIAAPAAIQVDLTVIAPASFVTTDSNTVTFASFTLGSNTTPSAQTIRITSLGAASSFLIRAQSTVPPGVNWFTVTPASGVGAGTLTIALNLSVLTKLGRGQFTGFFDIIAPGAPNSPARIMVFATVFPDADFTINPTEITFSYNIGDPAQAPQSISVDPVGTPQGNTNGLTFSPYITLADARDPMWLRATPSAVGLGDKLTVSLDTPLLNSLGSGDHVAYLSLNSPALSTGVDPPNSNTSQRVNITLTVTAVAAEATTTQVLSQIADGSGWQTKIVLINTDLVNSAPISLRFWPGQDTPTSLVPILTTGPLNDFTLRDTIPAGGSRTYLTQGSANLPLWQGWGELSAPPTVGGTAVFRQRTPDNQDIEGAVPLKPADGLRFVLPFDCSTTSAGQFVTSMAIINASGDQTASVTATATDTSGTSITLPAASASLTMLARSHAAFALCNSGASSRFPALAGKRGTLVFSTPAGQISGLGLRFSPRKAFTSIGTLTTASGATTKRVAHIAEGASWQTDIVIVNLDTVPAGVTLRFNRSNLTPTAPLALTTPGLIGTVYTTPAQSPIPPNGSLWLSTVGTSPQLWEGWAELTSNANVNGFGIFRNQFSASADAEGAVPFTSPGGTRFLLPFDNTSGFATSLAVVSPDASQAAISATFRNSEGNPIAPAFNSMMLAGHTAFSLVDPRPFNVSGSGSADFTTTGTEMFGIGLLFNPRNSFTSLPLIKR